MLHFFGVGCLLFLSWFGVREQFCFCLTRLLVAIFGSGRCCGRFRAPWERDTILLALFWLSCACVLLFVQQLCSPVGGFYLEGLLLGVDAGIFLWLSHRYMFASLLF